MRRIKFAVIGCIAMMLGGCRPQDSSESAVQPDAPVLKIAVFADGRLTVDGAPATLESLRPSLHSLSERQGTVWYYREAAHRDPPPIAMEVLEAVVEARLPIRLSSQPDYSDSVGADGTSIPDLGMRSE